MDESEVESYIQGSPQNLFGKCSVRSQSWSPEKIEQLADLVQPFPCLYDKRDKDFKDSALKTAIWEDVGAQLECTGHEAMRKWLVQRDRFNKERQLVEASRKAEDGAVVYQPKWRLYPIIERVIRGIGQDGEVSRNFMNMQDVQNVKAELDLQMHSPIEVDLNGLECDLNDNQNVSEESNHNSFNQIVAKVSSRGRVVPDVSCSPPLPSAVTSTAAHPISAYRINTQQRYKVRSLARRPFYSVRPPVNTKTCPQQPTTSNNNSSGVTNSRTIQFDDLNSLLKAHQAMTNDGDEISHFCKRLELRLRKLDKSEQRSVMRAFDTHLYDLEAQEKYNPS